LRVRVLVILLLQHVERPRDRPCGSDIFHLCAIEQDHAQMMRCVADRMQILQASASAHHLYHYTYKLFSTSDVSASAH
jgi:hypothetical protein